MALSRDAYYDLGLALEGGCEDDDHTAMELFRAAGGDLNAIRNPRTGVPILLDIQVVDDPVRLEWIIQTFRPDINIQDAYGKTILFNVRMPLQSLAVLIRYGINVRHERKRPAVSAVYYFEMENLVKHVEMCLENGAKLRHVEEATTGSSVHALVEKMRTRANRCYRVCLYFFEMRKIRVLPLDMARLMARMVWATRRQAEWD
jgi:hypothetical protein